MPMSSIAIADRDAAGHIQSREQGRDHMTTQRTIARSGGFRYNPTMSRTFSTNCGSLENLKFSTRCGCNPKARQIRTMAVCDSPVLCAINRVLQCVLLAGIYSNVFRPDAVRRATLANVPHEIVPAICRPLLP